MNNAIVLVARLLLAKIFLLSGLGKLGPGYAGTQGYMEAMGLPSLWLFHTFGALALAAFCIVSALIFHRNFGDQMQMIMFMKNFAMAGGLLMLYVYGAGKFSFDAKRA